MRGKKSVFRGLLRTKYCCATIGDEDDYFCLAFLTSYLYDSKYIMHTSYPSAVQDVSLGTSKTNYIDPRIIHSWCKREEVDLRKVYSATLVQKFPWAQVAGEDWRF